MSNHTSYRQPLDRPLKPSEIALIEWMLAEARESNETVLTDWSRYRVVSGCDCGCGTLDLSVAGVITSEETHRVLADAYGTSPEGTKLNVILHGESGIVTELEIMPVETNGPHSLPRPEDLYPWPGAG